MRLQDITFRYTVGYKDVTYDLKKIKAIIEWPVSVDVRRPREYITRDLLVHVFARALARLLRMKAYLPCKPKNRVSRYWNAD